MIGNPYKGRSFRGLLDYLFHGRQDDPNPHRVEWFETRNLPIDDPDVLPRLLRATAAQSVACERPVYHLPISWPPEERLDRTTQLEIVDQLLTDLGLSEHECVVVAHNDGDCPHVHLVVNRVHPETGRVWNAWRDVYRIMDSLDRQERQRGLRIVERPDLDDWRRGERDPERRRDATRGERQRAEREGDQPLSPWSEREMRDVRTAVTRHFRDATSWHDLEQRLKKHGLELRRAGQGFRVTDGQRFMTLSKIGKHARWDLLEKRFGRTWQEHEATRSLRPGEQAQLEPSTALQVMRGEAARNVEHARVDRGARIIDAWRAHAEYEAFRARKTEVAGEGRKLAALQRSLRRNEWVGEEVAAQLNLVRENYEELFARIYRNPVQAMNRLRSQLRSDKDWKDINLSKIGKVRGVGLLGLKASSRRAMRRIRPAFTRLWKLEAKLEALTEEWHALSGRIAAQERLYEAGRRSLGEHAKREKTRTDLYRKRAAAFRRIDMHDIKDSEFHPDTEEALMAVLGQEQSKAHQRRIDKRGRWFDRER